MSQQEDNALKTFKGWKIYLAVFIGLGATGFLFYSNLGDKSLKDVFAQISNPSWKWLAAAIVVLIIRDLGYIYRIRHISNSELTWKGSTFTIILWEFASALTPSVVGGTAVAIFILNREGIKTGKSVAYVTLTAILDNMFFIIAAPLALFLARDNSFLNEPMVLMGWTFPLNTIFYISYSLIAIYTFFMAFGVLISPRIFQNIILFFARFLKLRKSWKKKAYRLSIDVVTAAEELKGRTRSYWSKCISSTIFVWTARYFMLNCLLAAFIPMQLGDHQDALAKQVILWVSQLIAVTPGAAGIAEVFLNEIFEGGLVIIAIALIWRILTYYAYLITGAIVLPKWLKRVSLKDRS